jgi:hypothetical protein
MNTTSGALALDGCVVDTVKTLGDVDNNNCGDDGKVFFSVSLLSAGAGFNSVGFSLFDVDVEV